MNPPSRRPATPRALLALAPIEREEFLPPPLSREINRLFRHRFSCDPGALARDDWSALLTREAPEVLVSCWQTPPLPQRLPASLRYVCHLGGSTRGLVSRRHLEAGLLVTNWGGSVAHNVAEGALTLILAALHRTSTWALRLHRDRGWLTGQDRIESLFERRVGLHGFGCIARELVKLLRPFGTPMMTFAPGVTDDLLAGFGVTPAPSLAALFAGNDIVVELSPLTPATRGVVTARELGRMRPGALFVNVARGAIVDEAALIAAAQKGRIQVALDVFQHEPLPVDSPLRGLSNVTLSPHVAGPSHDRRRDAGAFGVRNLQAYCAGQPLAAVVTPEIYDQAT